jgi:FAD-dependent oxidoreductase domain-containing protein 1
MIDRLGRAMTDVVIAGGGIMGCATALHLKRAEPGVGVVVLEPDPTYAEAATSRASGGVRQLFTRVENIALSQYTLDVIDGWRDYARADGEPPPDLGWKGHGYLFIATPEDAGTLEVNLAVQRAHGVAAEWLEPDSVGARFPAIATADLGGAVLSPRDGWLDPHAFLQGLRRAAEARGARFVPDRAVGFDIAGRRVRGVALASGGGVAADAVVNAAGCWAPGLSAAAGVPVPVEPMRRFEHTVHVPPEVADTVRSLPFVKDPRGLAIRPEGPGLSVGLVNFDHPGGFDLSVDQAYFERSVWPALVHRVPGLDRLRLHATSVGLYDQNRLDGNAIVGRAGALDNYYLACGFSGHGLMHAPGVGRALSELILHGEYRTIDLTALGYERVVRGDPYPERGIR